MKKILFALLLVSGIAQGQGDRMRPVYKLTGFDVQFFVPGYTNISARYKWIATAVDSGLHIPQYNGVPTGTRTGVWSADGAIAADTANGYLYLYSGGGWIKFAKFSDIGAAPGLQAVIITDPVLTQDNTIDVGANLLKFKDIGDIEINRWGHEGFYFGQRIAAIGMPVVRLKPRNGNTQMSFDIYPRGNPNDTFNIGKAWFDVVNTDFDSLGSGNTAKLFAGSAWVGVGQSNYGVAAVPFLFTMGDGNIVGSMNADDSWTLGKTTEHNIKIFKDSTLFLYGTGTQEAMRITNAGVVTITGANALKYVDGNQGASKVLTSDANGVASWQTPGAGATPTLQQVLDAGSTLTSSENIATGINTLTISTGTTLIVPLNVTSTDVPTSVFLNNSITQAGVRISKQTSATTQKAVGLNILHTTSGTPDVGFGSSIEFESETVSGQNVQGYFNFNWADPITASRTSHADILGIDNAVTETFMNIQPSGVVRVNNLADTLATKAYARSVGGGGGTPGGSDGQFQYNDGGVFGGATGLVYDDGSGNVTVGTGAGTSGLYVKAHDGGTNKLQIDHTGSNGRIISHDGSTERPLQVWGSTVYLMGGSSFSATVGVQVGSSGGVTIPSNSFGVGGSSETLSATSSGVIINDGGGDKDTRIEGDTDPNLIFANAGTDKVGIKGDPHSSLSVFGSFSTALLETESGITLDASHHTVVVTATGQTITLPTAASITGRIYTIKLTASGSCTVATTSSQTIDGSTTYSLASQYKYVTVQSNGSQWHVIANN